MGAMNDTVRLLQELGATDRSDTRKEILAIPKAREHIFNRPGYFSSARPSLDEQELIVKGVCYIEYGDFQFGSTTVIPKLLGHFRREAELDRTDNLTNWLLSQRRNVYIPFGNQVPLDINTLEDYYMYEQKRKENRQQKLKNDQEISKVAKEYRAETSHQHIMRSLLNRLRRKHD